MSILKGNQRNGLALFFDGATSGGNPGEGGCAAVCYRGDEELFRVSSHLGVVTSNAAEYGGLILGLRKLLRDYPIHDFSLTVYGDSELVINQVEGTYSVKSIALRLYHTIVMGLIEKVKGSVDFRHIPRDENKVADQLAKDATKMKSHTGDYLVHYPSLCHLLDVKIGGKTLIAGQDVGAAAKTPEILFDATTVLETFGGKAMKTLLDPGKTSYVSGKSNFTVLGVLREPVVLSLTTDHGERKVTINDAVVVDFLPYDVQLSIDHPDLRSSLGKGIWRALQPQGATRHEFTKSVLPERFQKHPYWNSKTLFLATGYDGL